MSTLGWLGLSAACAAAAFAVLGLRVLHPNHRRLALGVWLLGWVPLGISVLQHRAELRAGEAAVEGALNGHWPHLLLVIGLLAVGWLVRVLFPVDEAVVPQLSEEELAERVDDDLAQLAFLLDKVDGATEALRDSPLLRLEGAELGAAQDEALRELWARFVEASYELDVLQAEYRAFHTVNPVTRTDLHARCFLVAYAAYVAEYRASVAVTMAVGENTTVRTVLDEANARHDIGADTYLALQRHVMYPDTLVRLNVGRAYLKLLRDRVDGEPILARTEQALADIDGWVEASPATFVDNPLDYLERVAFDTWFPIQKRVTQGLSAVHLPSRECFLGASALEGLDERLEPGDLLLMRREWHLTNLGIPGYWTHAALYVGSLEELDAYFDRLEELGHDRASDYIRSRCPQGYRQMFTPDAEGRPLVVLEAVTKGVRLASFAESARSDSLAAMRPRKLSRSDKLRAILDGLAQLGKPYDFNFDFATDNEIVCSELVYKAFERPEGIHLVPEAFNGRLLLSPNDFCEKLDLEWDGERELDFVFFLDGVDRGEVIERDVEALRESHRRPKWHILVADAEE